MDLSHCATSLRPPWVVAHARSTSARRRCATARERCQVSPKRCLAPWRGVLAEAISNMPVDRTSGRMGLAKTRVKPADRLSTHGHRKIDFQAVVVQMYIKAWSRCRERLSNELAVRHLHTRGAHERAGNDLATIDVPPSDLGDWLLRAQSGRDMGSLQRVRNGRHRACLFLGIALQRCAFSGDISISRRIRPPVVRQKAAASCATGCG
jgi:hypothetical protein